MRNFWIITVANPWCDLLLRGLKTMELRKKIPSIQVGDVIFVCRKGCGTIVGAFKLVSMKIGTVNFFCHVHDIAEHRLAPEEVKRYADGHFFLYGLRLSRIWFDESIRVEDFGFSMNPQSFYCINRLFWHKIPESIWKELKDDENKI